jgi:hypothetical protein
VADGAPADAARLLGHADALRTRDGTPRTPLQDRAASALAGALGAALGGAADALRTAGRTGDPPDLP